MPNLGPTELLIIGLVVILVVAGVAAGLVLLVRLAARPSTSFSPVPPSGSAGLKGDSGPVGLQAQVQSLLGQGKKIHAVKLVRERTGLGLAEAKRYVDDLAAGRLQTPAPFPGHLSHPGGPPPELPQRGGADLADRVRDLKASGRAEQAVFLVRGETGMTEPDAWRFVDSIH
ncbi:ribosomal protein L7/L12 [Streptosporangium sp. NPDC051023]|uniref:ribosomal protein L7/L12 n=1 Tax=Streptosporangium sp. NPDC051023 TaxID=3155410 RepID=UPI00344CCADD